MSQQSSNPLFRDAALAEGGAPVSAGARFAQIRQAIESGRLVCVDLSRVPEQNRPAIVAQIKQLVDCASNKDAPEASK